MLGQEDRVEWRIAHIGEALFPLAYDRGWFNGVVEDIAWCDAIIWTTPVYTMLVPWQRIRFINLARDLARDTGKDQLFAGKYATSMLTCFHYYDHLAEEWLRSTSEGSGHAVHRRPDRRFGQSGPAAFPGAQPDPSRRW